MRFDILQIIDGNGKRFYQLTVYILAYQPPEKNFQHRFTNKRDLFRFIKDHYNHYISE